MSVGDAKSRLDRGPGEPATGFIDKTDVQTAFDDLQLAWVAHVASVTDQNVSTGAAPTFAGLTVNTGVADVRYASGSLRQVLLGGTIIKRQQVDAAYSVFEVINGTDATLFEVMADGQANFLTDVYIGDDLTVVDEVRLGSTGPKILRGTGSPEGVKIAAVGSTYHREDGGAGTSFYVKESDGLGSTGWATTKQYVDGRMWFGTQAEYDALGAWDSSVLYVVT